MSYWIEFNHIIHDKRLIHGETYWVRLFSGAQCLAVFNVYEGGEEAAWLLPGTWKELSVKSWKPNNVEH